MKKAFDFIVRNLALFVIVGALLDVGVFAFQTYQYQQVQTNAAKSNCWDHLLDHAITVHASRAVLTREAKACARLP